MNIFKNKSLLTNILTILLIIIGYFSPYYSMQITAMGLYAFSGAITNWLAIHMLFEKVPFLYGSGIVVNRFEEFKIGIKNLIMNQFFTQENFEKFMQSGQKDIFKLEDKVLDFINYDNIFNKLKQAIIESPFGGMLGMFGGEQALEPLRPSFENKFKESIAEILSDEKFLNMLKTQSQTNFNFAESIDSIVNQRLDELTPIMVKEIIQTMIREHLGWLVVWGGVFGAIIGLVSTIIPTR